MVTILSYLIGTALIIYSICSTIKAWKKYRRAKEEANHYNKEAETEEVMTMYENGQETG